MPTVYREGRGSKQSKPPSARGHSSMPGFADASLADPVVRSEDSGSLDPANWADRGKAMDLVLGVSMTSTAVRWVLVEGTTGEGAPVDRGTVDVTAAPDADGLLEALLDANGVVAENRVHAIGVTWTCDAEDAADTVLDGLAGRGFDDVVAVSEIEAAETLARGIADITDHEDVAVCIVEPDAVVVVVVDADDVTVDRLDRDGSDAVELATSVDAIVDIDDPRPEAIFVLGSDDDLDAIVSALDAVATSPVMSAAEADMALARGAALASAIAVNTLDAQAGSRRHLSGVGAVTSVLAAAVVTFLVSVSVALGLQFTPESGSEQPQVATAADEAAPVAIRPSVAKVAPSVAKAAPPSAAATPNAPSATPPPPRAPSPVARTIAVAAPPVPQAAPEPVYVPPAAAPVAPPPAAPPATPVYVPPANPGYVQPPGTAPKPRLRDRIIERIPIINRFHDPEPQYGP